MSSKNFSKKSEDKAEKQALKEAEIVAELAPNEKTRKEAEQLIEAAEDSSFPVTIQEQEKEAVESVLDETKRAIKKTVNDAKREIPRYTKALGQLQEETIQATKEIGYESIELQREIATLIPQLQERFLSYCIPWMSPKTATEYYVKVVDSFVDNAVAVTNLTNNLAMVNLETIQSVADANREALRVGVYGAKTLRKSLVEP